MVIEYMMIMTMMMIIIIITMMTEWNGMSRQLVEKFPEMIATNEREMAEIAEKDIAECLAKLEDISSEVGGR